MFGVKRQHSLSRIHRRRHPTRPQSTNLVASLSFVFFLFMAIVLLYPVALVIAKADNRIQNMARRNVGVYLMLRATRWLLIGMITKILKQLVSMRPLYYLKKDDRLIWLIYFTEVILVSGISPSRMIISRLLLTATNYHSVKRRAGRSFTNDQCNRN